MWLTILKGIGTVLSGVGLNEVINFLSPSKESPTVEDMFLGIMKYITLGLALVLGIFFLWKRK